MSEFSFDVQENLGVVSKSDTGWQKEIKLISWNGRPVKYDIREWSPDQKKMSRGITFTEQEMITLKGLLNKMEL